MFTNINPNQISQQRIPSILDYEIITSLGTGGHGSAHKVKSKNDNQFYALKMIPQNKFYKNGQKDEEEETNYLRETQILFHLNKYNNPKIIKIYEVFQDINYRYIVTEFAKGKNLLDYRNDYIKNNEYIKQRTIIKILKQLLEVLIFLHDQCKIIHRDIRPENIIIDEYDNIKLLDFGLAAYIENQNYPELVSRKSFKGCRLYVPPEILYMKYNYDYKIDIFSLGFTIYFLMNPIDLTDDNKKVNLPQFTDRHNQRTVNTFNNDNEFYEDWLIDFIKTFYLYDPSLRPTAAYAYQYLLNNENKERIKKPSLFIKRFNSVVITQNMNINTGLEINKNFNRQPTSIQSPEEFLLPNKGKENKIITSMKSLIQLLSKLEDMTYIEAQFLSVVNTNKDDKLFINSYNNIFTEFKKKNNDYDEKINDFITKIFLQNESKISGPRPIILYYMISSIINKEINKLCPNYKNKILDDIIQNEKLLDVIIPYNDNKSTYDSILEKIKIFKQKKRNPFVDNFNFLTLEIKKCPQCESILNADIYQCEFLQLNLKKNEDNNNIIDLIEDCFQEKFPENTEDKLVCNNCENDQLISEKVYCLNAPNYLVLELEDKKRVTFLDEITLTLYNSEIINYKFIGAIYKKKVENHSEFYTINKEIKNGEEVIIIYDNGKFQESNDNDLINSENPSMAIYQKNIK